MLHRLCTLFATAFPLWIVLGCARAWWRPADWTWFGKWLAGKYLPIDALALFKSMLLVVLLPLLLGIAVNSAVGRLERPEKVRRAVDLLGPVPSVISVVYHCLIGSLLAAWWRRRSSKRGEVPSAKSKCEGMKKPGSEVEAGLDWRGLRHAAAATVRGPRRP